RTRRLKCWISGTNRNGRRAYPPAIKTKWIVRSTVAVDLVEYGAGGEMLLLSLVPTAEHILDCHQANLGELALEDLGDGIVIDAVAILGGDLLALGAVEEIEIGLGGVARALLVHHLIDDSHRELGEQAD